VQPSQITSCSAARDLGDVPREPGIGWIVIGFAWAASPSRGSPSRQPLAVAVLGESRRNWSTASGGGQDEHALRAGRPRRTARIRLAEASGWRKAVAPLGARDPAHRAWPRLPSPARILVLGLPPAPSSSLLSGSSSFPAPRPPLPAPSRLATSSRWRRSARSAMPRPRRPVADEARCRRRGEAASREHALEPEHQPEADLPLAGGLGPAGVHLREGRCRARNAERSCRSARLRDRSRPSWAQERLPAQACARGPQLRCVGRLQKRGDCEGVSCIGATKVCRSQVSSPEPPVASRL